MKNLRRSLKYLKPYRGRLIVSVLCVVMIMVLWGGGLGMVGPAGKILIAEEGLHGWAHGRLAGDHLGLELSAQRAPTGTKIDGRPLALIAAVVRDPSKGPAREAGIKAGDWIVGLYDGQPDHELIPADELMRILSRVEPGSQVTLRTHSPMLGQDGRAALDVKDASFASKLLDRGVSLLPEPQSRSDRFKIFVIVALVGLAMTYLRDVFRFIQEYLVATAVYSGIMDMRCDIYDVSLRLPVTFFSEKGTSDTMSRFVADSDELAQGQETLLGKTVAEPGKAIGALVMALVFSWKLTLLAMVVGPPAFLVIRKLGKIMKRASRRALEGRSSMLAVLAETLTGIRVVKAYTMEGAERRRFFRTNRGLLRQQKRMARVESASAPLAEAMGVTAGIGAATVAAYWVLIGEMTFSDFLALMGCMAAMFDPVRKLAKVVTRFHRAESAATRIFELYDREQERSLPGAAMLPRHSRSLEFRNVRYRYPSAADDALKDVNLFIRAGETVAVVGPNGSGKTTLVSLLPRLLDPAEGEVLVDGRDVAQHSIRSLRRQIGLVTQETILFNATIAENISYGLRRANGERVLEAARKAYVDEFVAELPQGYETMVGEHGATLSGGQRQRIAIARAILRDPAILIFDEAMSQIDSDSERRIHQAMAEFVKGRTTLLVAHRFATVLSADRIVMMNAGKIVDTGKHEELLKRCESYRHLYQTQFVDSGGDGNLG